MVEIKRIEDEEVMSIKENHVLSCFTDYLYHKHVSDEIQKELEYISSELSTGSSCASIIKVSKDSKGNVSPWQNELITREHELIREQDKHEAELEVVNGWLDNIKNTDHRNIVVEYLINNRCENAEGAAKECYTSTSNVSAVAKRLIKNIARRIK